MNKLFLLVVLSLVFKLNLNADETSTASEPLVAYKSNDLWHFIDYNGKLIFKPLPLNNVLGYSEGMFCVSQLINGKEKWGFIDLSGKFVIEPEFDMVFPFSEGFSVVYVFTNSMEFPVLYSIIDKKGNPLNRDTLISALSFSEGLSFVMTKDRKSGYINKKGDFVLEFNEINGEIFSEGFASVSNNSLKSGFINKSGKQIIDFLYETVGKFSEGLASVFKNQKFGYIDSTGKFVIEPTFDYARSFNNDRAFVGYLYHEDFKTRWAVIDKSGKLITDYNFAQIWDFSEDLAAVRDLKAWGFIDKNGNFVIEPKYFYTASFVNGLAWASQKENNIKGYIDKNEEYKVVLPECVRIIDLRLNKRMF